MNSILIVDDDEMQLRLWGRTMADAPFRIVATHDPKAAIRLATQHQVAAALIDAHMGAMSGPSVVRQLRSAMPDLPIIAISVDESTPVVVEMMQAGACEYLIKPISDSALCSAILSIIPDEAPPSGRENLTRRESQVLDLLAEGFSTGDLAKRLELSPKTIAGVFIRLRAKTRCESAAALRRFAVSRLKTKIEERAQQVCALPKIGHARIDHQHEVFYALCKKLIDAIDSEHSDIQSIAEEVFAYAMYHASEVESLMRKSSWNKMDVFKQDHQRHLSKFLPLMADIKAGKYPPSSTLRKELSLWVEEHVAKADAEFVSWLSNRSRLT